MQPAPKFALLPLVVSVVLAAGQSSTSFGGEPINKSGQGKLYDTNAKGSEQIAAALKTAKAEDKRVLLKFGANW
jgi:hypothetical protein